MKAGQRGIREPRWLTNSQVKDSLVQAGAEDYSPSRDGEVSEYAILKLNLEECNTKAATKATINGRELETYTTSRSPTVVKLDPLSNDLSHPQCWAGRASSEDRSQDIPRQS